MDLAPYILSHGNWISMEEFMNVALYDEEGGYYSKNIPDIGFRGDFSTSATMSSLLARRIANQWRATCKACKRKLPLIEIGGGNAYLAMAIKRELSIWERLHTRYLMVDRSRALRHLQALVGGHSVSVFSSMQQALKRVDGRAFIFCNELPDAFPVRQFVFQNGKWMELGLAVVDGRIIRQAWDHGELPASSAFSRWEKEGQVIEVHESYHKWYAEWQGLWKCGSFLTIDYGQLNDKLYARLPQGSLRGYKAHCLLSADELPPLAGHCDITADVNFTDLIHLAQGSPGDIVRHMNQHDYLAAMADPANPADQHLISIPGAGDAFQALLQHRFET